MSDTPEFSRMVDRRSITAQPLRIEADEAERAALAQRFDIVRIATLTAEFDLQAKGEQIDATGHMRARLVQSCAISGDDLEVAIDEPLALHFVPAHTLPVYKPDEEVELDADDLDEIAYEGSAFDLGEAVAQSLALAIDPYAVGPEADEARRRHGLIEEGSSGPLADALRVLKKDL